MGYVTKQWLKQEVERKRGHCPDKVNFVIESQFDDWSQQHGVVVGIFANKRDEYQAIYLTKEELTGVSAELIVREPVFEEDVTKLAERLTELAPWVGIDLVMRLADMAENDSRIKIIKHLLVNLDNDNLLQVLEDVFAERKKRKEEP